ncbi:MAG: DUF3472 domain-containing protein [Gemmatimonadaceae bacterium]|nr:DUF3472 domain-containing protein [Gemmatimonadaceae bacterium]
MKAPVLFAALAMFVALPRAELRVPAFTAYLIPDADAVRISATRPVMPFVRAGASLAWFGQIITRGAIEPSVAVQLPRGDTARLRLTVGAEHRDAMAIGGDGERRVSFGTFAIADTGYRRFELAIADSRAAPTLEVRALVLDGPASAAAHFNLDPRRNAASVHLRYPTDSNTLVTGFYNEVTAVDDPVTTYYMACGFARGYFGMQVNSLTERRIIFSVWDAASGTTANDRSTVASENYTQLVAKGDGVVADVFGNEGTGGHSHLVYPWKTGSTQRFFVTATPDGEATVYSGYWFHPERRAWQLIASFRAAKDGKGLRRLYSFSENFGGTTGHLRRKALYGSQWIQLGDRSWQELTTATFSHDATGKENRLDRFMGVENGRFFLSHGGFAPGFTTSGTAFTRPPAGAPPSIDLPRH